MPYACELKDQHIQPTLAIRTRAAVEDLPRLMGETYGAIAQYLGQLGECPAGPPFAAYHNMDMQDLDIEIGFPVSRELPGRGNIQAGEITAGRAVTCLYTGPYESIGQPYEALSQWIEEHGDEPTGVSYEFYLNDPQETPPQELQTEIMFPLK